MPKKPGAYHRPENIQEALGLLGKPDAVILAGGTKLLAGEAGLSAEHVVDLQALGMNQVVEEEGTLTIGSTCRLAELADLLARDYPLEPAGALLRQMIHREGPNTYRNAATIGGTIASRLPDSELLAALLVLDAKILFAGHSAAAEIDLPDYLDREGQESGLISAVRLPWAGGQSAAERVARTPADYAIVSITAWRPAGEGVRLAATGLGPRPQRVPAVEAIVENDLNEETIAAAAEAAKGASRHPGDFRGDAAYRAQMAKVLTRRVLQELR